MNEELEYAEMLEIPISTVNVVKKKRRRKQKQADHTPPNRTDAFLRDSVIAQVNEKLDETADVSDQGQPPMQSETPPLPPDEGYLSFEPDQERLQTVRLYASDETRVAEGETFDDTNSGEKTENGGIRYATNGRKPSRVARILLKTELAVACALCGAIFFTNAFLPNSAINTFFRAMNTPKQETAAKHYSEFDLAPIVSLRSDADLNLSSTGVLSFTDDCFVYPAANGTVQDVSRGDDGFTVKVNYTDAFTGVFYGLNQVYYAVGDEVKANVPVGYATGENEVQVTMYANGNLLNCFELTEENCLAWIENAQE